MHMSGRFLGAGLLAAALAAPWVPPAAAATSSMPESGSVHESGGERFRVTTVAEGLANPWSIAFLPDGDMLVTERPGRLRIVRDGRLLAEPVSGVPPVTASGQGGLFDVVPHPEFARNRLLYLSYAGPGPGGASTEVARGRLEDGRLLDVETIFTATPKLGSRVHFGGRLAFGPDGMLYLTSGDRGEKPSAQNLADHRGAVMRLADDGGIPPDNPFVERAGAVPELFSYGHRNPQGMAVQPGSGLIWTHEHGARGGDEVNILLAGANYGWPLVTHGVDYDGSPISDRQTAPGITPPLHHWTPSIAPSGMAFYEGDLFPNWRGDLFVGALAGRHLVRLEVDGDRITGEERMLTGLGARIRDVRTGPDGRLYLLTDARDGALLRLEEVDG